MDGVNIEGSDEVENIECNFYKAGRGIGFAIGGEKPKKIDNPKKCIVGSTKNNPIAYEPPENIKIKFCTTSNFVNCERFKAAPPWQKGKSSKKMKCVLRALLKKIAFLSVRSLYHRMPIIQKEEFSQYLKTAVNTLKATE